MQESVGLPIITQQTAEQIFHDLNIFDIDTKIFEREIIPRITLSVVYKSLHNVATMKYSQLKNDYLQLTTEPRKRARKYNTYELALTCFTLEPLLFALMRHEIEERLRKLPIPSDQVPPSPSLGSMLNALTEFQKIRKIELLEWRPGERTLYILEPAFLSICDGGRSASFHPRGRLTWSLSKVQIMELLSELRVLNKTTPGTQVVITAHHGMVIGDEHQGIGKTKE